MLSAGMAEAKATHRTTVERLQQALASSLVGLPQFQSVLAQRMALFNELGALVDAERAPTTRDFLQPRTVVHSHSKSKQIALAGALNLADMVGTLAADDADGSGGLGGDDGVLAECLKELALLLRPFNAGALFNDWSPRVAGIAMPVPESAEYDRGQNDPGSGCLAENSLPSNSTSWSSKQYSSKASITINFKEPTVLTSVVVEWATKGAAASVTASAVPASVAAVDLENSSYSDKDYVQMATQKVGSEALLPGGATEVPLHLIKARAVKITFTGYARFINTFSSHKVASVVAMTPDPDALHTSIPRVAAALQDWLAAATPGDTDLRPHAMRASLRLAMASGSASALLRLVRLVLQQPDAALATVVDAEEEAKAAADAETRALEAAILAESLEGEDKAAALAEAAAARSAATNDWTRAIEHMDVAKAEAAERCPAALSKRSSGSGGGLAAGPLDLKFDPALSSQKRLEFSNDNKTFKNPSGGSSNVLGVCDHSFSSGVVTVTWSLDLEAGSCFGFVNLPQVPNIDSVSYTHSSMILYRSYTGDLYGNSKTKPKTDQCRVNAKIKMRVDFDERTIEMWVNDVSKGVLWNDFEHDELWPCIQYYEANHQVTIVDCVVEGQPGAVDASAAGDKKKKGSGGDDSGSDDDSDEEEATPQQLEDRHPGIMVM